MVEETAMVSLLNRWFLNRNPPVKILSPTRSKIFPIILPIRDACTTCIKPALSAKIAIINSIAFPNVAEKRPLTVGFVCNEISLVVYPIILARGTIARTDVRKMSDSSFVKRYSKRLIGMNTKSK
jgi:hypothetical protein